MKNITNFIVLSINAYSEGLLKMNQLSDDILTLSLSAIYEFIRKGEKNEARRIIRELAKKIRNIRKVEKQIHAALRVTQLAIMIKDTEFAERFLMDILNEAKQSKKSLLRDILPYVARLKAEIVKIRLLEGRDPGDMLNEVLAEYESLAEEGKLLSEYLSFLSTIYLEAMRIKHRIKSAEEKIKNALELVDKTSTYEQTDYLKPYIAEALASLAEIEYELGKISSALNYLSQAFNIYIDLGWEREITEVGLLLSKLHIENNDKETAKRVLEDLKRIIKRDDLRELIINELRKI